MSDMGRLVLVRDDEVVALWNSTECTGTELAERFGVSANTIYSILAKNERKLKRPVKVGVKRLSNDVLDSIDRCFEDGLKLAEIAKVVGVGLTSVRNHLKSIGKISSSRVYKKKKKKDIYRKKIKALAAKGFNRSEIAKKIGISTFPVNEVFKEEGIKLPLSEANRKDGLKVDYFEKIDTAKKSYLLGWLYSDGCNMGTRIQFRIKYTDREILDFFKKAVSSGSKVKKVPQKPRKYPNEKIYQPSTQAHFQVCSKKMALDLISHGMSPRKSLKLNWRNIEKSVPRKYIKSLVSG